MWIRHSIAPRIARNGPPSSYWIVLLYLSENGPGGIYHPAVGSAHAKNVQKEILTIQNTFDFSAILQQGRKESTTRVADGFARIITQRWPERIQRLKKIFLNLGHLMKDMAREPNVGAKNFSI